MANFAPRSSIGFTQVHLCMRSPINNLGTKLLFKKITLMIETFFEKHFEEYPEKVLVAVSGGADSMALTFLLDEFCRKNNIKLMATTVDHGMREGSDVEAIAVGKILLENRISHKILSVKDQFSSNIEANLRNARYDLLYKFAKENGIKHVFNAHHKDDLAENFLIRLFRGSQLDGVYPMREIFDFKDVKVCRPLLNCTKQDLLNYLKEKNIDWFEDESNKDERFLRNKIRSFLASFDEQEVIRERIVKFGEYLKESKEFEDEICLKNAKEVLVFVKNEPNKVGFLLNLQKYRDLGPKIRLKMLSLVMAEVSQKGYKPRLDGLERFESDVLALEKGKKRDFYGCQAKLLTKSNAGEVLELIKGGNLEDFVWIYPSEEIDEFRFRTLLRQGFGGQAGGIK